MVVVTLRQVGFPTPTRLRLTRAHVRYRIRSWSSRDCQTARACESSLDTRNPSCEADLRDSNVVNGDGKQHDFCTCSGTNYAGITIDVRVPVTSGCSWIGCPNLAGVTELAVATSTAATGVSAYRVLPTMTGSASNTSHGRVSVRPPYSQR